MSEIHIFLKSSILYVLVVRFFLHPIVKSIKKRYLSVLLFASCLMPIQLFITPNTLWALEYSIEYTDNSDVTIYTIPIGKESVDEFGNLVYQLVDIEDFYVKKYGTYVYPNSMVSAELYAASRALSHLFSYSFIDAADEVSIASSEAQTVVSEFTEQQLHEAHLEVGASLIGGTSTSLAIGATICVGSLVTGPGVVVGCAAGAVTATVLFTIGIFDAVGTAYTAQHDSAQNYTSVQNTYFAGKALMDKGFSISVTSVEPWVTQNSGKQHPINFNDIAPTYRNLGKIAAYYAKSLEKFEATGVLTTKPLSKRVAGAFGLGAIPSFSSFMAINEYVSEGYSLSEAREALLQNIDSEKERIDTIDIFSDFKQTSYQEYFLNNWGVVSGELLDIAINLLATQQSHPGKMRLTTQHISSNVLVKDLFSYHINFGDGYSFQSSKANGINVPVGLVDHVYAQNGEYTASVEFTTIDGRTSTASVTFDVITPRLQIVPP